MDLVVIGMVEPMVAVVSADLRVVEVATAVIAIVLLHHSSYSSFCEQSDYEVEPFVLAASSGSELSAFVLDLDLQPHPSSF